MSAGKLHIHPFKQGVRQLLKQHFEDAIANRFELVFEVEQFTDDLRHIWNQKKDNNLIMEVYYREPSGLTEYICDIFSWMTKAQCEVKLLRYITDKVKTGVIGRDWLVKNGKFSEDIRSGKYETPDTEITKYMAHNARKEEDEVPTKRRTGNKKTG